MMISVCMYVYHIAASIVCMIEHCLRVCRRVNVSAGYFSYVFCAYVHTCTRVLLYHYMHSLTFYSAFNTAMICVFILKWVIHGRLGKETWIDPDSTLMMYRRMFVTSLFEVIVVRSIGGRAWLGTPMWNWMCNGLGANISGE